MILLGFVYMWCDELRNKYYIGSHKGSPQDGYICGSKRFRSVYNKRPHLLIRHILEYCYTNRDDLLKLEEKWLKFHRVSTNPHFYNFRERIIGGSYPRAEGYVSPLKGKRWEEIFGSERADELKNKLKKRHTTGTVGIKKGDKHKQSKKSFQIYLNGILQFTCNTEQEFFRLTKLEASSLMILKKIGQKQIKRRLPATRHMYQVGDVIQLKYLAKIS